LQGALDPVKPSRVLKRSFHGVTRAVHVCLGLRMYK